MSVNGGVAWRALSGDILSCIGQTRYYVPNRNPRVALQSRRPVVFMHIPKTSGVAITSGLMVALAPDVVVNGFDRFLFGYDDFDSIDPKIRCSIYDFPALMPENAHFVSGHFAFSTLREAYPCAQYLTLLREPLSRLLSHWLFWRQQTEAELAPWGGWADHILTSRRPLAEFLRTPSLASQIDNLFVRALLWPHPLLPAEQFIDPAHDTRLLRQATARLQAFDFVDIVDDGAFVHRLRSWIGAPFQYAILNETRPISAPLRSPLHQELTAEAMDLLERRSRLDVQLWTRTAAHYRQKPNVAKLRERTILTNVARYSTLMACPA